MHASESSWPDLDDLVSRVICVRRRIAAAHAEEAALLAESVRLIGDRTERLRQQATATDGRSAPSSDLPLREVSLELGAAMRLSDRAVQARISDAYDLTVRFGATFAALTAGDIDAAHAAAIVRAGALLTDDEDRVRYQHLALEAAATESPTRTAAAAKAIAATIRPDLFAQNAREAADDRSVRLYDLEDGIARLIVDGPAPLIHAVYDRLTSLGHAVLMLDADDAAADVDGPGDDAAGDVARADVMAGPDVAAGGGPADAVPADGAEADAGAALERPTVTTGPTAGAEPSPARSDPRTMDQVRTDLLCDLLLTGAPSAVDDAGALGAITARIQVTVPALTLAGDPADAPALLAGHGPIDPRLARRLAGLSPGWDRVFTDPSTGEPLAIDRYRPSVQLQRYLAARDERCRAPGCTRRAHRCDLDHTVAAAEGGATDHRNLACFCRRHHICKHHTAWRVRQVGHGVLEWTGPTGRRYRDRPPAVVRFVPDAKTDAEVDAPPPF